VGRGAVNVRRPVDGLEETEKPIIFDNSIEYFKSAGIGRVNAIETETRRLTSLCMPIEVGTDEVEHYFRRDKNGFDSK
jgi:hypothetical protein